MYYSYKGESGVKLHELRARDGTCFDMSFATLLNPNATYVGNCYECPGNERPYGLIT